MDYQGSIPDRGNDMTFSFYHCVQTGIKAHSASYPTGIGGLSAQRISS
jgi:hypothetical protein